MALTLPRAKVYAFARDHPADVFNFAGLTPEQTATIRTTLEGAKATIALGEELTQEQMEGVAMVMETYCAATGRSLRNGSQTTKKPADKAAAPEPDDLAADAKAIADGLESVVLAVAALSHEAEEARKAFQAGDVAKVVLQDPALIEKAAARLTALAKQQSELMASAAAKHPGELTLDMDGPAGKRARTKKA